MRIDVLIEDLQVIIIATKSSKDGNGYVRRFYVKSTVDRTDSCFNVKIWSNETLRLQIARQLILTWLIQRLDEHSELCHKYSCETLFESIDTDEFLNISDY